MYRLVRITCFAAAVAMMTFAALRSVTAHEGATGVIKERMDAMESMAKALKAIAQRVKANRDLDAIKADAQTIHALAGKMTSLFPPGSHQHPSEAKPAIWERWPDFETKARTLAADSERLAQVDPKDARSVGAQARAVSQACGSCHELYRAKMPRHEHMH